MHFPGSSHLHVLRGVLSRCADHRRSRGHRRRPERGAAPRRVGRAQVAAAPGHENRRHGYRGPISLSRPRPRGVFRHRAALGLREGGAHGPQGLARGDDDDCGHDGHLRQGRDRRDVGGAGGRYVEDDDRNDGDPRLHPEASARTELRVRREHGGRDGHGRVGERHGVRSDRPRERVHHRRRQHDGREDGHAGQAAQQRVHPGSRGQDRRLRSRVRPRPRRHDQRRDEIRRQRVPGRRVRVLRFRVSRFERLAHGRPERREPGRVLLAEARRRRRGPRRLLREGPALVLRGLRPRQPGSGLHAHVRGAPRRRPDEAPDVEHRHVPQQPLLRKAHVPARGVEHDRGLDLRGSGQLQRALRPHADLGHDRRGRRLARRPERRRIRLLRPVGRPFRHAVPRAGAGRLPHGEAAGFEPVLLRSRTWRSSRRGSRRRRSPAPARSSSRTRSSSVTSTGPQGPCSWDRTRSRRASTGST